MNDGGVLSVSIHSNWAGWGGAHENVRNEYVNDWLDEECEFTLKDALTPAAKAVFEKRAKETIKEDPNPDAEECILSTLSLGNEKFVIEPKGIRLFSTEDNVLSSPNREQNIFISFEELRGAIKTPGPLTKLAAPR